MPFFIEILILILVLAVVGYFVSPGLAFGLAVLIVVVYLIAHASGVRRIG